MLSWGLARIPDSKGYKGRRDTGDPAEYVYCDHENKPSVSAIFIFPPSHVGDKLKMKISKSYKIREKTKNII